eukprot:TRINITY_DN4704_c0_g1_i3.p1 TRINITY_DN4704_c0_g1~~TRINITY_DN4704_c0_g1_i3.p1  ORF type:complete len:381 (+),score=46.73 TRINITY_DN4704_c0_g1_i3:160-1302(+)
MKLIYSRMILAIGILALYNIFFLLYKADSTEPARDPLTSMATNSTQWSYSLNDICIEETTQALLSPNSLNPQEIETYKQKWKSFLNSIPPAPKDLSGKGIVITAHLGVIPHTLRVLRFLQYHNTSLPIEIWHKGEFSESHVDQFTEFPNVVFRDLNQYDTGRFKFTRSGEKFFSVKGGALVFTSFSEILLLDSDNLCLRNPEFLFNHPAYLETGAIFWPDYWKTRKDNPIWDILEIPCTTEFEQESGQLVVNKSDPAVWKALNLATFFQTEGSYGIFSFGDKDTYRWAWRALKMPYHMVRASPGSAGKAECHVAMLQFSPILESSIYFSEGFREEPLFLHLTLFKKNPWTTADVFQEIRGAYVYCFGKDRRLLSNRGCAL